MADQKDIRIVSVPQAPIPIKHRFDADSPASATLSFAGTPLPVRLGSGDRPLAVDMRALLSARQALPLCLSLCEAICADSDYQVDITLFDRPVMTIRLRGRTRFFSCGD